MSAKRKNSFFRKQYFSKFSGNKKKWIPRNSCSLSKKSDKYRKIDFQLIDQEKVEINPTFFMPPQIVTIIKKYNAYYNVESKAYQIPFRIILNYIKK